MSDFYLVILLFQLQHVFIIRLNLLLCYYGVNMIDWDHSMAE